MQYWNSISLHYQTKQILLSVSSLHIARAVTIYISVNRLEPNTKCLPETGRTQYLTRCWLLVSVTFIFHISYLGSCSTYLSMAGRLTMGSRAPPFFLLLLLLLLVAGAPCTSNGSSCWYVLVLFLVPPNQYCPTTSPSYLVVARDMLIPVVAKFSMHVFQGVAVKSSNN
jgi:hypothetical protein